jgi:hypothetical protein
MFKSGHARFDGAAHVCQKPRTRASKATTVFALHAALATVSPALLTTDGEVAPVRQMSHEQHSKVELIIIQSAKVFLISSDPE